MNVLDDNRPRYRPMTPSPGQEKAIASLLERLAAASRTAEVPPIATEETTPSDAT